MMKNCNCSNYTDAKTADQDAGKLPRMSIRCTHKNCDFEVNAVGDSKEHSIARIKMIDHQQTIHHINKELSDKEANKLLGIGKKRRKKK